MTTVYAVDATYTGFLTGWIECSGVFHPCEDYQHSDLLFNLGKPETVTDRWVHVGTVAGVFQYDTRHGVTQSQLDTLADIVSHPRCPSCLKKDIPYFIHYETGN